MKKILILLLILPSVLFSQVNEWLKEASTSYELGKYKEAKELFNKVVQNDPENSNAYYFIGMCELMEKEFQKAIENFSSCIRIDKKNPDAYNSRGIAYSYTGDLDFAISDFDRAIILDPNFTQAYLNRGSAFVSKKMSQQAFEDFDKVLSLDPNNPSALFQRGRIYTQQKNYSQAIIDYNKAVSNGFRNAEVYYEIGNNHFMNNDLNKAVSNYSIAIEKDPYHHQALNNRAVAYDKLGMKSKAQEDRKKLSEMAGIDFDDPSTIKYKNFKSSDNWLSVLLPEKWKMYQMIKDDNQVEVNFTPKDWNPNSNEPMAIITISIQKNMKERYNVSAYNELLDFWSGSNAKNSENYANYDVISQKMLPYNEEFEAKLYETLMQISENGVVYRSFELVAAKENYLMYAYFQAPQNQFEYYQPIFLKAINNIELK